MIECQNIEMHKKSIQASEYLSSEVKQETVGNERLVIHLNLSFNLNQNFIYNIHKINFVYFSPTYADTCKKQRTFNNRTKINFLKLSWVKLEITFTNGLYAVLVQTAVY